MSTQRRIPQMADMNLFTQEAAGADDEPAAKRTKLKAYDLVPAQALNAMGVSRIESISLPALKDLVCAGNKAVSFFSEYADKEPARRGIAISRMAQVMLEVIDRLDGDVAKKVLNEKVRAEAWKEASELKPYLTILNGGMNCATTSKSMKYASKVQIVAPSVDRVKEAATKVFEWLNKRDSYLRSLLAFLSGGGLYFAAACHEKTSRAFLSAFTKELFIQAAVARLSKETSEETTDDMGMLKSK